MPDMLRFGRYSDRYKDLQLERSIGYRRFGEAEVNCCFHTPEAKWGLIGDETVGILYFSLTFSQNSSYRLDRSIVDMTFTAADPASQSHPIVLNYFSPRGLFGPERGANLTRWRKFNPHVDVPGIVGVDIVDFGRSFDFVQPYRWVFTGTRLRGQLESSLHQRLRWMLDSNKLEPQAEINRPIHGALVIKHASVPFSVEVEIQGKLRGHFWRGMLKRNNKERGEIVPESGNVNLESEAKQLESTIARRNDALLPEQPGDEAPYMPTMLRQILAWPLIQFLASLLMSLLVSLGRYSGYFANMIVKSEKKTNSPLVPPPKEVGPQVPVIITPMSSPGVVSNNTTQDSKAINITLHSKRHYFKEFFSRSRKKDGIPNLQSTEKLL